MTALGARNAGMSAAVAALQAIAPVPSGGAQIREADERTDEALDDYKAALAANSIFEDKALRRKDKISARPACSKCCVRPRTSGASYC